MSTTFPKKSRPKISWADAHARLGRNDWVAALVNNLEDLEPNDLPRAVHDAWTAPEWPEQILDTDSWVYLFGQVGYMVDGVTMHPERDLGDDVITLYRGAIPRLRSGLAWTRSFEQAHWFAHRFDGIRQDEGGKVWKITVPIDFVLARVTTRQEDEVIVDTTSFDDEEYQEVTEP